jgi:hypothetical protein
MRWRKRRAPSDVLVGKVGDYWIMFVPRSGKEIGRDEPGHDLPYGTLFISATKPVDDLDVPKESGLRIDPGAR